MDFDKSLALLPYPGPSESMERESRGEDCQGWYGNRDERGKETGSDVSKTRLSRSATSDHGLVSWASILNRRWLTRAQGCVLSMLLDSLLHIYNISSDEVTASTLILYDYDIPDFEATIMTFPSTPLNAYPILYLPMSLHRMAHLE